MVVYLLICFLANYNSFYVGFLFMTPIVSCNYIYILLQLNRNYLNYNQETGEELGEDTKDTRVEELIWTFVLVLCLFTAHNYFQTKEISLLTIEKHLLANSQKMLTEFLNNSKTATLVIDEQMTLLFRNKKATELFKLTDDNWKSMLSREMLERVSSDSSEGFVPTEGSQKSDGDRKSIASIINKAEKLVDLK